MQHAISYHFITICNALAINIGYVVSGNVYALFYVRGTRLRTAGRRFDCSVYIRIECVVYKLCLHSTLHFMQSSLSW